MTLVIVIITAPAGGGFFWKGGGRRPRAFYVAKELPASTAEDIVTGK
jgi:hypothetical protein